MSQDPCLWPTLYIYDWLHTSNLAWVFAVMSKMIKEILSFEVAIKNLIRCLLLQLIFSMHLRHHHDQTHGKYPVSRLIFCKNYQKWEYPKNPVSISSSESCRRVWLHHPYINFVLPKQHTRMTQKHHLQRYSSYLTPVGFETKIYLSQKNKSIKSNLFQWTNSFIRIQALFTYILFLGQPYKKIAVLWQVLFNFYK